MSLAASALSYAENGWLVFPLESRNKTPLGRLVPQGFKNASRDPAQVQRWWVDEPEANIGVATGRDSGLIVIDFDPRNGADVLAFEKLAADELRGLKFGRVATGGGGQHWYFAYPDLAVASAKLKKRGIDVKSDGGYIVAPPSIHPDGGTYVWIE